MHLSAASTFKLSPVNGLSRQVKRALVVRENNGTEDLGKHLGSLFAFILDRLESYPFVLVRANSFSLVNVSTSLGKSFGYSEVSFKKRSTLPSNLITFTFCLTGRPLKKIEQLTTIDLISNDFLFGPDRRNLNYLTITVDQSTARKYGIDFSIHKQLEFLYNTVGLVSKSFVVHPRGWWDSSVYSTHFLRSLYNQFYEKQPEYLFKEVPIGYWHYNKKFWQDYSHLLVPKLIDEGFYKYFTVFILDGIYVGQNLDAEAFNWIYGPTSSLTAFVESGIRKLMSEIHSSIQRQLTPNDIDMNIIDDSVHCVIHLLYRYHETLGVGLDDQLVASLYTKILRKVSKGDGMYSETAYDLMRKLFAVQDKAAYALIDQDVEFQKLCDELFEE